MNERIKFLKDQMKSSLTEEELNNSEIDIYIEQDIFNNNLPEGLTPILVLELRDYEQDYKTAAVFLMEELVIKALTDDTINGLYAKAVLEVSNWHEQVILCAVDEDSANVSLTVENIKEAYSLYTQRDFYEAIEDRIKVTCF